jgi:hypothetical protein
LPLAIPELPNFEVVNEGVLMPVFEVPPIVPEIPVPPPAPVPPPIVVPAAPPPVVYVPKQDRN